MPWKTKTERDSSFFRRTIVNKESARKAAMDGFGAAMFVAGVTALFAIFSYFGVNIMAGIGVWSLLDAAIFAFVGWRIHAMSRTWAVLGLLLYLADKGYGLYLRPSASGVVMIVILVIAFINGVRGTFAFHKYSSAAQPAGTYGSTSPPPL